MQPRSVLLIAKTVKESIVHAVLLSVFNGLGAGSLVVLGLMAFMDQILTKTRTPAAKLLFLSILLPSVSYRWDLDRNIETVKSRV